MFQQMPDRSRQKRRRGNPSRSYSGYHINRTIRLATFSPGQMQLDTPVKVKTGKVTPNKKKIKYIFLHSVFIIIQTLKS